MIQLQLAKLPGCQHCRSCIVPEIPWLFPGPYFLESSRKACHFWEQAWNNCLSRHQGHTAPKALSRHVDGASPKDPAGIFDDAAHFPRQTLCSSVYSSLLPLPSLGQPSAHTRNCSHKYFSLNLQDGFGFWMWKSQSSPARRKKRNPQHRIEMPSEKWKPWDLWEKWGSYLCYVFSR